jgi:hypothetical protein
MIVRVRYTWLRTLNARKKTQINEVYFLAVSQGCSSFAIHYCFLRILGDPPKFQPGFFLRECSQLDQRRRQEYAVANSLLLKKSSIIRKKQVFVNILSMFYRTFLFCGIFCHCSTV